RDRSFGRFVLGLFTRAPSMKIEPLWIGSSAFTHLISVDFPEPDGPQTTTTSPLLTRVVQFFRTWNVVPYHLEMSLISIMLEDTFTPGAAFAFINGWTSGEM